MFYINFVFKVNFLNKQKNSCENCKKKTITLKKTMNPYNQISFATLNKKNHSCKNIF